MASSLHHGVPSLPFISFSSLTPLARERLSPPAIPLAPGELLHQPSYYLFSSINSSLGPGFPGCETFVSDANPLQSGTKPPACQQQLQCVPNP